MSKLVINYIMMNVIISIFIIIFSFFINSEFLKFNLVSLVIICSSSAFVFFIVYLLNHIGKDNSFFIYLLGTIIKNAVLLGFCIKFRELVSDRILYLLFLYMIFMFIEIFYIHKLIKE